MKHTLRLFVSSPQDVECERRQVDAVVNELNRTIGSDHNFAIVTWRWERDTRAAMTPPQPAISRQITDFDIFVGIMWRRFGSPTMMGGSGTEEEFRAAYTSWKAHGRPHTLFYFCEEDMPTPTTISDAEQLLNVTRFRSQLKELGRIGTYAKRGEFADVLRVDLHKLSMEIFNPPLQATLGTVLWNEQSSCRKRRLQYYTTNTLLALLSIKDGVVNSVLPQEIIDNWRDMLTRHVASEAARPDSKVYTDFRIEDRPEVRAARDLAVEDGQLEITERHLLRALLVSNTNTMRGLARNFPTEFSHLQQGMGVSPSFNTTPLPPKLMG